MNNKYYSDVVIVGGGLSGFYTALNLNSELNVVLVMKEEMEDSSSVLAQGGIAACIVEEEKDFLNHMKDTIVAGSGLNDETALKTMVFEAPQNIKRLIEMGVKFDRDETGELEATMEGGHSKRRILHAGGDATGREVIKALKDRIKKSKNIEVWENTMAVDLISKDDKCCGVKVLKKGKIVDILSKAVVLATGGIGVVYKHSTNPDVATGDGIAMAYRIGAKIDGMEFIQFHPTALYTENEGRKFLISEAVRGEGAYLRNKYGERFMLKIHPKAELAPRDVVSQSIYWEMKRTNSEFIYLDITHKEKEFIKKRFPTIYSKCLEYGIDMSKDLVPVVPVEHYSIGGIKTNIDGRTNIKGLYACGECANTGVHGANRLASNSLLECIVFGRRIAEHINSNIYSIESENLKLLNEADVTFSIDQNEIKNIRMIIKETMDKYAGIVRTTEGLQKAQAIINNLLDRLILDYKVDRYYLETLNMATVSKIIIESCLQREESIGCHLIVNKNNDDLGCLDC